MKTFEAAFALLKSQHGMEVEREVKQLGIATTAKAKWVAGATDITLVYAWVIDSMIFNIAYSARQ